MSEPNVTQAERRWGRDRPTGLLHEIVDYVPLRGIYTTLCGVHVAARTTEVRLAVEPPGFGLCRDCAGVRALEDPAVM